MKNSAVSIIKRKPRIGTMSFTTANPIRIGTQKNELIANNVEAMIPMNGLGRKLSIKTLLFCQ